MAKANQGIVTKHAHPLIFVSGDSHFICYHVRIIKPTQVLLGLVSKNFSEFFFPSALAFLSAEVLVPKPFKKVHIWGEMAHQSSILTALAEDWGFSS